MSDAFPVSLSASAAFGQPGRGPAVREGWIQRAALVKYVRAARCLRCVGASGKAGFLTLDESSPSPALARVDERLVHALRRSRRAAPFSVV